MSSRKNKARVYNLTGAYKVVPQWFKAAFAL
jgi:hypothetical protein